MNLPMAFPPGQPLAESWWQIHSSRGPQHVRLIHSEPKAQKALRNELEKLAITVD